MILLTRQKLFHQSRIYSVDAFFQIATSLLDQVSDYCCPEKSSRSKRNKSSTRHDALQSEDLACVFLSSKSNCSKCLLPNSFGEQFNLPSLFNNCGDEHGNLSEVFCQEDNVLIFLGLMKYCAQQPSRMHLASVRELQLIHVVSDDARLLIRLEMMS